MAGPREIKLRLLEMAEVIHCLCDTADAWYIRTDALDFSPPPHHTSRKQNKHH